MIGSNSEKTHKGKSCNDGRAVVGMSMVMSIGEKSEIIRILT